MVYEKPEVRTLDVRAVLENLGPAVALLSGGGGAPQNLNLSQPLLGIAEISPKQMP